MSTTIRNIDYGANLRQNHRKNATACASQSMSDIVALLDSRHHLCLSFASWLRHIVGAGWEEEDVRRRCNIEWICQLERDRIFKGQMGNRIDRTINRERLLYIKYK